jgi:hypothetical protein
MLSELINLKLSANFLYGDRGGLVPDSGEGTKQVYRERRAVLSTMVSIWYR